MENKDFFISLENKLNKRQMKISYFDLSNAWWNQYTQLSFIKFIVHKLKSNYQSETKFVLTSLNVYSEVLEDKYKLWEYHFLSPGAMGVMFKNSITNKLAQEYLHNLSKLKRLGQKTKKCVTELLEKTYKAVYTQSD